MAGSINKSNSSGEDVGAFLEKLCRTSAPVEYAGGRLIFAMDATKSRQPTWDKALGIQGQMFVEAEKIGGLKVQLMYFRGFNECKASKWVENPESLARLMSTVDCQGGNTQIGKVLRHVKTETASQKVNAVIYVGDAQEEKIDPLCQLAGEIGILGTPLFMFQEGEDAAAQSDFKELTRLSNGAYFKLDANSPAVLAELLGAVAAYAAGGRAALAQQARHSSAAQLLLQQMV